MSAHDHRACGVYVGSKQNRSGGNNLERRRGPIQYNRRYHPPARKAPMDQGQQGRMRPPIRHDEDPMGRRFLSTACQRF